jgi:DNA-binding transcriptional LysR family regulator
LVGQGIAPAHRWLVADCLADGRLETVLPDYAVASVPLSLLIVPERAGITRVRLLADCLAAELRAVPGIAPETAQR